MGVEVCRCPGEVIILGGPLVLGPLVDAVLGVVTIGAFGLVTHLPP